MNTPKIYALFLSLLPVIQMYRTPGLSVGLSTSLISIALIYAIGYLIKKSSKRVDFKAFFYLSLYLGYVAIKSSGAETFLFIAMFIHLMALAKGAADSRFLLKLIVSLSLVASCCVILQQFCHFIIGKHIPFIMTSATIAGARESEYAALFATGITIEGTYRPSAFFMEPAHFSQYCILGLGIALYHLKSLGKALLISLGILATSSGMGLVLVFALWYWWRISKGNMSLQKRIMMLITVALLLLILIAILHQIPYFAYAISRIIGNNTTSGYNAIDGRIMWWNTIFGGLSVSDLILGFGTADLPDLYMTGFMKSLYCYGIVGFGLLSVFLLRLIIITKGLTRTFTFIYICLLFIANLLGFIPLIFNIGTILTLRNHN